jgi:hypothetical protein
MMKTPAFIIKDNCCAQNVASLDNRMAFYALAACVAL